jgi:hypothetical protein
MVLEIHTETTNIKTLNDEYKNSQDYAQKGRNLKETVRL